MAVGTVRETAVGGIEVAGGRVADGLKRQRDSLPGQLAGGRRAAARRLLQVVAASRRFERRRHAGALAPQQRHQLAAEALARHAVQEEVDGVVDARQLVDDGARREVRGLRASAGELPAVSTHRQHDARRHADDERHGRRDAHQRRLREHAARRRRRRRAGGVRRRRRRAGGGVV